MPVPSWEAVCVGVSVPDFVEPWLSDCVCDGVDATLPVWVADSDAVSDVLGVCEFVPDVTCVRVPLGVAA